MRSKSGSGSGRSWRNDAASDPDYQRHGEQIYRSLENISSHLLAVQVDLLHGMVLFGEIGGPCRCRYLSQALEGL
jgi:hypothetical protein